MVDGRTARCDVDDHALVGYICITCLLCEVEGRVCTYGGFAAEDIEDMGFQDDDRDMCERMRVEEERCGVRG